MRSGVMATEILNNSISTGITLSTNSTFIAPLTLSAQGTINAPGGIALYSLLANAALANFGLIEGGPGGVEFAGVNGLVVNAGTIGAIVGDAVSLDRGGIVDNSGLGAM